MQAYRVSHLLRRALSLAPSMSARLVPYCLSLPRVPDLKQSDRDRQYDGTQHDSRDSESEESTEERKEDG